MYIYVYTIYTYIINLWTAAVLLFESFRSSRPDAFCKKVVLKKFAKFTGKHSCQSLFFNKYASIWCKAVAQTRNCRFSFRYVILAIITW